MAAEYQDTDWRIADYQTFCLDPSILDAGSGKPLYLRGPRPSSLMPGTYFACIGAAQTFGRFCPKPYPTLLQERLGLPVLNISRGGAGPGYFDPEKRDFLRYVNGARLVVVQVMSGRSANNSLYESDGLNSYRHRESGAYLGCDEAFDTLLRSGDKERLRTVVRETRENWLSSYTSLLCKIRPPTILFWFSPRSLHHVDRLDSLSGLFGDFPQLVNAEMMERLRAVGEAYVECRSQRGRPQRLVDRFTGGAVEIEDPWTSSIWRENWYYPTPEMHVDATDALEPSCRSLLGLAPRAGPIGLHQRSRLTVAPAIHRLLSRCRRLMGVQ